jgi:CubicO group peptidase (beta-lactamase class C family)
VLPLQEQGAGAPKPEDVHAVHRSPCRRILPLASTAAFAEDPLPRAKPEEVGFSSERLARIDSVLKADIDAGRIPGAVIAIVRHGKLVKLDAYGFRDKEAKIAMTTDSIFNIASMTKPMTSVGALMLYEQGKLVIDDPLSARYAKPLPTDPDNGKPQARSASGTDWWADPKEELVVVHLSAAPGPIRWHYRQKINALVYQAIVQ